MMAEVGKAINDHTLTEDQLKLELWERMWKLVERRPLKVHAPEQTSLLQSFVPSFTVHAYRIRRVGNFTNLLVQGKRADDTEEHVRIWVGNAKRNKTDKPNHVRAAEICLNRVAEDILLNKPLN